MRVALLHNPGAGDQAIQPDSLTRAFQSAGHQVSYYSTKESGWHDALLEEVDVIVAAGGDGTIGRVAIRLAERPMVQRAPLAVLPIGSANNVARSLHATSSVFELASALEGAKRSRLAVGIVRGPWGATRFVEAAGVGLFAAMLRAVRAFDEKRLEAPTVAREGPADLEHGVSILKRELAVARPRALRVEADGTDLSGEYLLAEAMNIPSIGPRVELAGAADPTDDSLDLVLLGEKERAALREHLEHGLSSRREAPPFPTRRARRVSLSWTPDDGHVDDALWPEDCRDFAPREVSIEVDTVLQLLEVRAATA